ncbi:unnamed protein product [Rotaria sp. Silwood1]|nr:unnamed protein product [Rotaria sp. Silwood1]CAF0833827.1 unnamed protein product [Rotaria sp. Silwood1]CAF3366276.1 unnamed protein product [Rotaria sp. Silwood1]CAF4669001.1 unnamed protein product [Rotaria sp. Silwood1]
MTKKVHVFIANGSEEIEAVTIIDGSKAMAASPEVGQILTKHYQDGKIVAAICAGPRVLLTHKIRIDHKHTITCYPTVRKESTDGEPYKLDAPDHAICYSKHGFEEKGSATSMVFTLKLIELLKGKDEATKVKDGLLI